MKSQLDTCSMVLKITNEKVDLLEQKSSKQEQLIVNLNTIIINKNEIIQEKDSIIKIKEEQIEVLKKEKKSKFWNGVLLGGGSGIALMAILFVL